MTITRLLTVLALTLITLTSAMTGRDVRPETNAHRSHAHEEGQTDTTGRRIGTWKTFNADGALAVETTYRYPDFLEGTVICADQPRFDVPGHGSFHLDGLATVRAPGGGTWQRPERSYPVELDHPAIVITRYLAIPDDIALTGQSGSGPDAIQLQVLNAQTANRLITAFQELRVLE